MGAYSSWCMPKFMTLDTRSLFDWACKLSFCKAGQHASKQLHRYTTRKKNVTVHGAVHTLGCHLSNPSVRPVHVKKEITALSVHQCACMRTLLPATQLPWSSRPVCKTTDRPLQLPDPRHAKCCMNPVHHALANAPTAARLPHATWRSLQKGISAAAWPNKCHMQGPKHRPVSSANCPGLCPCQHSSLRRRSVAHSPQPQ